MLRRTIASIFRLAGQRKLRRPEVYRRPLPIASRSRESPTHFPKWYSQSSENRDESHDPNEDTDNKGSNQNLSKSTGNSNESGRGQSSDSEKIVKRVFYSLGTAYFLKDILDEKGKGEKKQNKKTESWMSIGSDLQTIKSLVENILGFWGFMERSREKGFKKTFLEWVNKCKGDESNEFDPEKAHHKIMDRLDELEKALKKGDPETGCG